MSWLEAVFRSVAYSTVSAIWHLPKRFSIPIGGIVTELPSALARQKGFDAVVTYQRLKQKAVIAANSDVAILIQGPTSTDLAAQQVIGTLELYASLFPGAQLIVSTWEGTKLTSDLLPAQVTFCVLEDPGPSYPTNLLRQQVSTQAALEIAYSSGCKYALKTRSDHRIHAERSLSYLKATLSLSGNENALCVSSYGSGRLRLYGFTDQLQFGHVGALLEFWRGAPESEKLSKDSIDGDGNLKLEALGSVVHETLLNVRYLRRLGFHITWTWSNHLQALSHYFPIADSSELGHFQLSRTRTVWNHVYPWNTSGVNELEEHLQAADWLCARAQLPFVSEPTIESLACAMKVPPREVDELKSRLMGTRK